MEGEKVSNREIAKATNIKKLSRRMHLQSLFSYIALYENELEHMFKDM